MRSTAVRIRPTSAAHRLLACVLAAIPFLGGFSAVVTAAEDHATACRDHVCACVRYCPPKRAAAAGGCHGAGASLPRTTMRPGGCQHEEDVSNVSLTRPHLLPAATTLSRDPVADGAPAAWAAPSLDGFLTIDLPPPRPRD